MDDRKARQTRTISAAFETREDGGELRLEGYFSVFDGVYPLWPGAEEAVDPHAFDDTLGDDVRALIDHETRLVLGRTRVGTLTLRVDAHGLWGSVIINRDDVDAMNLYARVKRGDVSQCSFGFDILEEREEWRDDGTVRYTLVRVKLYEVSVVTFPAYRDTEISARREQYEAERARRLAAWRDERVRRLSKWH